MGRKDKNQKQGKNQKKKDGKPTKKPKPVSRGSEWEIVGKEIYLIQKKGPL